MSIIQSFKYKYYNFNHKNDKLSNEFKNLQLN
jgi:hypothetical protein